MFRKRVLLIESGKFIGGVIHSLVSSYDQLIVFEAAPSNENELLKIIGEHRPDIIVMDDTLMEYLSYLLNYMSGSQEMRVIVVDANRNRVDVYQKQQINVKHTADFFAIM